MFDTDNSTLERTLVLPNLHQNLLFTGNLLLTLTSLLFNSVVLYGAIMKQALKSDLTTVLLLEFLTVLDLLITLFSVVPVTIVSFSGRWTLGPTLCVVNAVARRYLYLTELMVVSYISLYRLSLVLFQRKSKQVGRKKRRDRNMIITRVILLVLVALPLFPLLSQFLGESKVEFVPGYLSCTVPEAARVWGYFSLAFLVIPSGIVILSNLVILYKVIRIKMKSPRRVTMGFFSGLKNAINPGTMRKSVKSRVRKINPSTYITICFICIFFVISYSPVFVIVTQGEDLIKEPPSSKPHWLGFLTVELLSLNVLSNPVVYTLSNMRFRRYVMSIVKCFNKGMNNQAVLSNRPSPESSGENVFNETISKFFSTARRTSAFTPSASFISSKQTSMSRSSIVSRAGPRRRFSEQDVYHSGKWCGPAQVTISDRRRNLSSTTMPNLDEDKTLSSFYPDKRSPLKSSSEVICSMNRLSSSSLANQRSAPSSYSDLKTVFRASGIGSRPVTPIDIDDTHSIKKYDSEPKFGILTPNGNPSPNFKNSKISLQEFQAAPNPCKTLQIPYVVVDENNYEEPNEKQKNYVAIGALFELHDVGKKLKIADRLRPSDIK
ncbi:hypothetical protein ACHWQZ_G010331 [Mnemiopsis leidyi]